MNTITQITQSHLSVFVFDKANNNPIKRMPMYAEIAIIGKRMPEVIDINTIDIITDVFRGEESKSWLVEALEKYFTAAYFNRLGDEERNNLIQSLVEKISFEIQAIPNATKAKRKAIVDLTVKKVAAEFNIPAPEPQAEFETLGAYPLGMLATDHVGYLSYNLKNVPKNPFPMYNNLQFAVYLYPMGKEAAKIDALQQGRVTPDVILAKLEIDKPVFEANLKALNLPAMQNPDLADWYMSPGSFAALPSSLIGADGCENLFPANFATQEFRFRQIVRLTAEDSPAGFPSEYRYGFIDEYKVSLVPIGHSLGEIKYSLPLAPGETVKLAIIDWSRTDSSVRTEDTQFAEKLMHDTHRDRSITETVNSVLNEWQRGGNVQAGANFSLGFISIGGGGGYSTSSGSRDLAAANTQKLSDSFSQASSALREFHSTVVVQSKQEEKQNIQTRTFSNYNHSHTLTILYYEILRHFRVVTEWVNRKPVALLPFGKLAFTDDIIINYRHLLESNLLDSNFKKGFDSLEKLSKEILDDEINGNLIPLPPLQPKDYLINSIFLEYEIGNGTEHGIFIKILGSITDGKADLLYEGQLNINSNKQLFNEQGYHSITLHLNPSSTHPNQPRQLRWKDIKSMQIETDNSDIPYILKLGVKGIGNFPGNSVELHNYREVNKMLMVHAPSTFLLNPPTGDLPIPKRLDPEQRLSIEENYEIKKLRQHLSQFNEHYNRVIYLNKDVNANAEWFEKEPWGLTPLNDNVIDHIEPIALEVFGSYIAYPILEKNQLLADKFNKIYDEIMSDDPARHEWAIREMQDIDPKDFEKVVTRSIQSKSKTEKLISIPTRGVFAEGKLGHCNISEEIDDTRFWKWEEHPIPIQATDINPINAVTPQPVQQNVQPTTLPNSMLSIQQPTAAPDPQGLAAALKVLATPNIFRDMSGRQEVADLLKKLADENISMTEAKNKAEEIQLKHGEQLDKQQKDYELGVNKDKAALAKELIELEKAKQLKTTPAQAQQEIKLSENLKNKGVITEAEHKQNAQQAFSNTQNRKVIELEDTLTFEFKAQLVNKDEPGFSPYVIGRSDIKITSGDNIYTAGRLLPISGVGGSEQWQGFKTNFRTGKILMYFDPKLYGLSAVLPAEIVFPGGANFPGGVRVPSNLLNRASLPLLEGSTHYNFADDKSHFIVKAIGGYSIKKIPIEVTITAGMNVEAVIAQEIGGEMEGAAIKIAPTFKAATNVGGSLKVSYEVWVYTIMPSLNITVEAL